MKKQIAILFLVLYLAPTLGVTVSWSMCNAEKMKANNRQSCRCKVGKPDKKCCNSNKYTFKFKESQQKAEILIQKFNSPIVLDATLPIAILSSSNFYPATEAPNFKLPRPPNLYSAHLYLLNRVFRI